jgi:hypothetical protein
MFDFLNQNASAIQAISAVLMIIITVALVWVTQRYVRYTNEMVEEFRTQNRPYIFLDFDMREGHFDLAICNLGNRVAQNVKFELIEDIKNSKGEKLSDKDIIKKGISYFPPQRRFIFGFDFAHSFLKKDNPQYLCFKVKYSDGNQKNYEDEFKYDLTIYHDMYFRSFSDIGTVINSGLKDLTRTIERVSPNNSMKRFLANIGTKQCPICGERISQNAKKCHYCNEWINESVQQEQKELNHGN